MGGKKRQTSPEDWPHKKIAGAGRVSIEKKKEKSVIANSEEGDQKSKTTKGRRGE